MAIFFAASLTLQTPTSKVQKSRKCVQSEWINFKEEDATLIRHAGNVAEIVQCFTLCGSYAKCKTINYNKITWVCQLREISSESECVILLRDCSLFMGAEILRGTYFWQVADWVPLFSTF